jgi:hypothetical protein
LAKPDSNLAPAPDLATFTLTDVHQAARVLLEANPEAILTYRLLREVLQVPSNSPELAKAKEAALNSKWVRQLEESQLPDGSWGRFHSQDTKIKTAFRTTEEAIDRAVALGLEPGDRILKRVSRYIQDALLGDTHITDLNEKAESWPLLVNYILAGRLGQIDPANKLLDSLWIYLVEVAQQAFASGNYCQEDESAAYLRMSGVHVPGGFLESQHALWILSSRQLPHQLDHALVSWIWHKPDGIRYIRTTMQNPSSRQIGYWLRSMNLLSRFGSWREISLDSLNHLCEQRDKQGLWDFGSDIARSIDFPLSESWRHSISRKLDYSTCILVLLRKFFY